MATKASQSPRFQPKPTTWEFVESGGFAHTEATEVAQYLPYCPFVYIVIADVLLWYSSKIVCA